MYELIERCYEAKKPEITTNRAEWYALVQLSGALERGGVDDVGEDFDYDAARRELAAYDGIPF